MMTKQDDVRDVISLNTCAVHFSSSNTRTGDLYLIAVVLLTVQDADA